MRDHDRRDASRSLQLAQGLEDALAALAIEVPGRLVGEEKRGATGEGARDRDALLLTPGELVGELLRDVGEADLGEGVERASPARGGIEAEELQRRLDVLDRGERPEEIVRLEDEAHRLAPIGGERSVTGRHEIHVADHDRTRIRAVEGAEQREERALPAAGRTDDGSEGAALEARIEIVQDGRGGPGAAKGLLHVPESDIGWRGHRARRQVQEAVYTRKCLARVVLCVLALLVLLSPRPVFAQDGDAGAPPAGGGDETVDLSNDPDLAGSLGPSAAQAATAKSEPPPKPDKFEFRGFTRLTAGAGIYSVPTEPPGFPPAERVPYDRAFIEQHLYLDMRYAHSTWFSAVASASVSLAAFDQVNQPSAGAATTSFDLSRLDAIVREAYVSFTAGRFDLRIGQQRIAWGNSDAYTPNDVLNGRDVRNPFLFDPEMLVLPSPAARADFDLSAATLSVVFEPFVPSDKFDLYGTNWAIVQPDAPIAYRRLFGALSQGLNRSAVSGLQDTLTGGSLSGSNPANASVGASLKTHIGSVDLSWYFLSGFDRQPAVYVDPEFQKQLEGVDGGKINGAVFEALLNQTNSSTKNIGGPILISYRRRNHVGMDAQTTAGPFVLRTEVAYDSAKTFFSTGSLNSVMHPVIQEVIGAEYQTGSVDRIIGVEAWAMQVLGPEIAYVPTLQTGPESKLLWTEDNNLGVAGLVRWGFLDNGVFELRSNVGVAPFWYSVRPEVGYQSSQFTVRAGLMALGGASGTFGEYYRRNSTAYLTSRFSF